MAANNVPADCWLGWVPILGAPWAFSSKCREAYDLRAAGLPDPPRPAAPVVPTGGYEGAVTDPRAVDDVIDRTSAATRGAFDRFFMAIPGAPEGNNGLVVAGALVGLVTLYVVLRRS